MRKLALLSLILVTTTIISGNLSGTLAVGEGEKTVISGKVIKHNQPIPNVEIYLYVISPYSMSLKKFELVSQTNLDGAFRFFSSEFGNRKREDMVYLVAIPPQKEYSIGWALLTEKSDLNKITIKLYDSDMISGVVTDFEGNAIENAQVKLRMISESAKLTASYLFFTCEQSPFGTTTDKTGSFTLSNLPKNFSIELCALTPGFAKQLRREEAGEQDIQFKLERGARIKGRVVYRETDEPAKNIITFAQGIHPSMGWGRAKTDENGHYVITNLPAGTYNVFLGEELTEWTAVAQEKIEVDKGETAKNIDLKIIKGGFITGRVTYEGTDEPLANQTVGFHDASRPESQAAVHSTRTDEDGFFKFRAAPGKALVYAPASTKSYVGRQVRKYVNVVEGETSNLNLQLKKGIVLKGTVISKDGKPVENARITDGSSITVATSDENGNFEITGLRKGQELHYKISQEARKLRGRIDMEIHSDTKLEISLESYETTTVSGHIVDADGNPISGVKVRLIKVDRKGRPRSTEVTTVTEDSGKYEIDELIAGDKYQILATKENICRGTESFTVRADISPLKDIVIKPQEIKEKADVVSEQKGILKGKIIKTGPAGEPVEGVRVVLISPKLGKAIETKTDEDGNYEFTGLPPGTYMISLYKEGYKSREGLIREVLPNAENYRDYKLVEE